MNKQGAGAFIADFIRQSGPMDVGQYMTLSLGHPEFGYYMTRDPFGGQGDFTTAPEISQIFGELIGAMLADIWITSSRPDPFILLECGPGRGTLMADILRATRKVEGFHEAMRLHLLEISPVLKEKQAEKLKGYHPVFIGDLQALPKNMPVLGVANEFLDALPIIQAVSGETGWQERVVAVNNDSRLIWALRPLSPVLEALIPADLRGVPAGSIVELSPARAAFIKDLCTVLRRQLGAFTLIDYGYTEPGYGDTLQALYRHQYVDPLDRPGEADITAHVDFKMLQSVAAREGCQVTGPVSQRDFLHGLGISKRADALNKGAGKGQIEVINDQMNRLVASDQMGNLFKVMGISYGG